MNYKVALIPGDGIGKEVIPESVRTLKALSQKFGFGVSFNGWGCPPIKYLVKRKNTPP